MITSIFLVKSEASSEVDEKRGRKRKTEDKEEMGREIKVGQ